MTSVRGRCLNRDSKFLKRPFYAQPFCLHRLDVVFGVIDEQNVKARPHKEGTHCPANRSGTPNNYTRSMVLHRKLLTFGSISTSRR